MQKVEYSEEQINEAIGLAKTLQQFSNKQVRLMCDHSVTDKTRLSSMIEVIEKEYGQQMINKVIKFIIKDNITNRNLK